MKTRRNFFRSLIFAICHLPLAACFLFSETYLGVRELGDPVTGAGARSVAMGSTGLSRAMDSAVIRMNPALLADLEGGAVSASLGPVFLTEKVVESSTATRFRGHSYIQINEAALALPFKGKRFWLGLSGAPVLDFRYEADSTRLTNTGTLSSENRLKSSGVLWAVTPSVSVALSNRFAIGVSYDFWVGQEEVSVFKISYASGTLLDFHEKADYSGGSPRVGIRWKAAETLNFGAVLQPSGKLTRNFDFTNSTAPSRNRSGKDKWDMPLSWGVGLSYHVPGEHDTEVALEIHQTLWGSTKVDGRTVNSMTATKPIFEEVAPHANTFFGVPFATQRSYGDITEIRVGLEHVLTPEWRLRLGFHHLPYFADRTVEATYFSAGAGYEVNEQWSWGIAGEMGKRDYKGENLFFSSTQRVDETLRRILFSGQWTW